MWMTVDTNHLHKHSQIKHTPHGWCQHTLMTLASQEDNVSCHITKNSLRNVEMSLKASTWSASAPDPKEISRAATTGESDAMFGWVL